MDRRASSGTTESLGGQSAVHADGHGGSTESLRDLHALQAWLKGHPKSNAVKVVEAYLDIAINHFSDAASGNIDDFREPWARIQGITRTSADPVGATGLSQYVKLRTLTSWFEARTEEYRQHCSTLGAKTLRFVEITGRPNRYGFTCDDVQAETNRPYVVEGAVLRWRREPVPAHDLSVMGRIFYPEGTFTYGGWRYALLFAWMIAQVITFVGSGALSLLCLGMVATGNPGMTINSLGFAIVAWAIYRFGMQPIIREADLRTCQAKPGTTRRGGPAWVDRINVNLGREHDDPQYRHDVKPHRQLVRWRADCAICGAPVELKSDSPVMPGLVGCCVESPDEHSFSFDRVTLEGRPLRARPVTAS